ncbi:MAG: hypothetical protein MnENMB40S_38620 [Rhizobiaceae bacterium MnEN-MB40S]|nr:MAG: hypothetical protein MnENMB40S_38620 [Rhizobiaceae bacterium MnEN-MB40S]
MLNIHFTHRFTPQKPTRDMYKDIDAISERRNSFIDQRRHIPVRSHIALPGQSPSTFRDNFLYSAVGAG